MISVFFLFIYKHDNTINNIIIISKFLILRHTLFPMTHHCRSILLSADNFQPISSQHCQRQRGTLDESEQSEGEKIQILMTCTDAPSTACTLHSPVTYTGHPPVKSGNT